MTRPKPDADTKYLPGLDGHPLPSLAPAINTKEVHLTVSEVIPVLKLTVKISRPGKEK